MENHTFRSALDRVLVVFGIIFLVSFGITLNRWMALNQPRFETVFYPAVTDFTFQDWRQEADGTWSAIVYMLKSRAECVYVKDQIVTYVGVTPSGEAVETTFTSMGDLTPGNNRAEGWQRLDDRQKLDSVAFVPGTKFWGAILHQCHDGLPTVSRLGDHTVGQDDPFPGYVQRWIAAGRKGKPEDYR